jgi:hypothetical protein
MKRRFAFLLSALTSDFGRLDRIAADCGFMARGSRLRATFDLMHNAIRIGTTPLVSSPSVK